MNEMRCTKRKKKKKKDDDDDDGFLESEMMLLKVIYVEMIGRMMYYNHRHLYHTYRQAHIKGMFLSKETMLKTPPLHPLLLQVASVVFAHFKYLLIYEQIYLTITKHKLQQMQVMLSKTKFYNLYFHHCDEMKKNKNSHTQQQRLS